MEVIIDPKTDVYKRFIEGLRHKEFEAEHFLFTKNLHQKLKHYVKALRDVKFTEETTHTLFGDIKVIVSSFICFFNRTMNDTIKNVHDNTRTFTRTELVEFANTIIDTNINNQIEFSKEYLPANSKAEEEAYKQIQTEYNIHMDNWTKTLYEIYRLDKQFKVDEFVVARFPNSIKRTNALLNYTHKFMALMLAGRLQDIDISVEVILLRVCNNLKDLRFHYEGAINGLLHLLYDKNKEWIYLHRISRETTIDMCEVEHTIEDIRRKIKNRDPQLRELNEEVEYWTRIAGTVDKIANNLAILQNEAKNVVLQQHYIQEGHSHLSPKQLLVAMDKIRKRKNVVYAYIVSQSKALFTMFQVRGTNEVLFKDETGDFFIDEYGHQVYSFDNYFRTAHLDCTGQIKEDGKTEKYYFDDRGRYLIDENGEKIYKLAPCTSTYKLDETTDYFVKTSKDCGHSETVHRQCRLNPKFLCEDEVLPDSKPGKFVWTLDKEAVAYLQGVFGAILPTCLNEVARLKPKNPIHYLAHQLLRNKYRFSKHVFDSKKKRAEQCRLFIEQQLKEKTAKELAAWKGKNFVKQHIDDNAEEIQAWLMRQEHDMESQNITDFNINL